MKDDRFETVLYALPERTTRILSVLPLCVKNCIYEIRLRRDKPVCLTGDGVFYVSEEGQASTYVPKKPLIITAAELSEVIMRITNHSAYTREQELKEGYLSMRSGNRAGVCGRFSSGRLIDVTSVNIRIARQIKGCADNILGLCEKGLLIAGPPGSGKTTMLRDLVRQLSNGGKRVCVIDSRGEICSGMGKESALDVGPNTDVITGLDKASGVEIALRTMFPDFIAFDEVGSGRELSLIKESFFSGVGIITTAHASSEEDIVSRDVTKMLLDSGIENIVLLGAKPGDEITLLEKNRVKTLA